MNSLLKVMLSVLMTFSMIVCVSSTKVEAAQMSGNGHDEEISVCNITVGNVYDKSNGKGMLRSQFTSQSTLLVTYYDLSNTSRYIKIDASASSQSLPTKGFVVNAGKNKSVSYSVNINNASRVRFYVYQYKNTSSTSTIVDGFEAIMQ